VLLACANVANLLLVRARRRALESAVMAALGCSGKRLLRRTLTESLLVALGGGIAGVALAWLGIRWLVAFRPPELSTVGVVSLDVRVLLYALGISVLSAIVFGLVPAIQASRPDLAAVLKDQGRGSSGPRRRSLLNGVVVGEVALSFVLLFGAILMTRTLIGMQKERPGFDPDGALAFNVRMYSSVYRDRQVRVNFYRELEERISALPGVQSVGSTNFIPMTGGLWNGHYAWDEESEANLSRQTADYRVATPNYFRAMGTRLLAGRHFDDLEMSEATSFVIVDEVLAQRAWPGENPIGKTLKTEVGDERVEVIGVVEHIRQVFVHTDSREAIYWAYGTYPGGGLGVIVRASGDPTSLVGPIREEVRKMDPDVVIYSVTTLKELVSKSMATTRFVVMLMGVFAAVAVVLTVVGLYGVVSYAVRQSIAEIGIRMALGAEAGRILRLVVGQGARLTVLGLVLGIVGALLLSRFVASLLFGVAATDPATVVSVALALSVMTLLACYLPARRATRTDPMTVLRPE
jgi:putative ABC transport system permease protein